MKRSAGFTLIEIMVVVVILGILAALIAPNVVGRVEDARREALRANLGTVKTALKLYKLDNFSYPNSNLGLVALVEQPAEMEAPNWKPGGYLEKLPKDPWGNDLLYMSPGPDGSDCYVYTLGADNKPGGDGTNADLSTSDL